MMIEREVTSVKRGGRQIPLEENPCDHCGALGTPYLAVNDREIWGFCSGQCLMDGLRVNGQPLTPDLAEEAGLHVIGPAPDA